MSTVDREFRWRSVAVVVLLPSLAFAMGQMAVLPVIPTLSQNLGTDLSGAALIASMMIVGQLLGDIPSGIVVARVGERPAMIGAAGVAIVGSATILLAGHPAVLAIGVLLIGVAAATFGIARHAFMTSFVPHRYRARALSTLGGTHRLGAVLGPLAGAGLLAITGDPHNVVYLQALGCAIAVLVLVLSRDPEEGLITRSRRGSPGTASPVSNTAAIRDLGTTLAQRRKVLATVGIGSAVLFGLRQVRLVVLPVWAVSIGLDDATTSLVIGVAGAIDFSLFFLGGWVMDRFGRLWAILPCVVGLSAGFVALAFTHDLDTRVGWFVGITLFLALGNGIGSGVLLTLGADLADRRNPGPFLGAWRFTTDLGGAGAPLLVTALTAVFSLAIGVATLGVIGLAGAGILRVYVPRFVTAKPRDADDT